MPGPWPLPAAVVPEWEMLEWKDRAEAAEAEVGVLRLGIQLASSYLTDGEDLAKVIRVKAGPVDHAEEVWLKAGAPTRLRP